MPMMATHRGYIECPGTVIYCPCPPRPPVLGSRSMPGRIQEWSFDPKNRDYLPAMPANQKTPSPASTTLIPKPGMRVPRVAAATVEAAARPIADAVRRIPPALAFPPGNAEKAASALVAKIEDEILTVSSAVEDQFARISEGRPSMSQQMEGIWETLSEIPWYGYVAAGIGGLVLLRALRRPRRRRRLVRSRR